MHTFWYLVGVVVCLIIVAIALIFELRTSPEEEAKRIEQQNEAMERIKDDPNEPARFVP